MDNEYFNIKNIRHRKFLHVAPQKILFITYRKQTKLKAASILKIDEPVLNKNSNQNLAAVFVN